MKTIKMIIMSKQFHTPIASKTIKYSSKTILEYAKQQFLSSFLPKTIAQKELCEQGYYLECQ